MEPPLLPQQDSQASPTAKITSGVPISGVESAPIADTAHTRSRAAHGPGIWLTGFATEGGHSTGGAQQVAEGGHSTGGAQSAERDLATRAEQAGAYFQLQAPQGLLRGGPSKRCGRVGIVHMQPEGCKEDINQNIIYEYSISVFSRCDLALPNLLFALRPRSSCVENAGTGTPVQHGSEPPASDEADDPTAYAAAFVVPRQQQQAPPSPVQQQQQQRLQAPPYPAKAGSDRHHHHHPIGYNADEGMKSEVAVVVHLEGPRGKGKFEPEAAGQTGPSVGGGAASPPAGPAGDAAEAEAVEGSGARGHALPPAGSAAGTEEENQAELLEDAAKAADDIAIVLRR